MELLDGKKASQSFKENLKIKIAESLKTYPRAPHLVAILIGNDGASETYVASKIKSCEEIGLKSTLIRFDNSVSEEELKSCISKLNNDEDVDGIIVQLPLPKHIREHKIINVINPDKDVDGFHPINAGKIMLGQDGFVSATPMGILNLLEFYNIETAGKNAVVIGRSNIVGRPISVLLSLNKNPGNCTVTVTHSRTKNISKICRQADIIIAAIGVPGFVKGEMVKQGAVVIDVGITRIEDNSKIKGYSIKGDVDFESVAPKCSYISPVPGGVGLMTISALLMNTYKAYLKQNVGN